MKTRIRYANVILTALVALALLAAVGVQAGPQDGAYIEKLLQVGDSQVIECEDATRAAIGDPLIADLAVLSSSEILLNAKSPGRTVLYIWDSNGRRVFRVTVGSSELNINELCTAIINELDDPRINARGVGNTIILEGIVSRESEASRAGAIAQAVVEMAAFQGTYVGGRGGEVKSVARPEGDSFVIERVSDQRDAPITAQVGLRLPKVVNLVQVEKPIDDVGAFTMGVASSIRQGLNNSAISVRALPGGVVLVEGRVGTEAEVSRISTLLQGWEKEDKSDDGIAGRVNIVNAVVVDSAFAQQVMVRAQVVDIDKAALREFGVDWGRVTAEGNVVDQPWLIGQLPPGPFGLFGGGEILRFDPIGARIRALQEQNKARVLSEPNLLVLDSREANILVGGEIPIPVVQSGQTGGAASVSVQYREFGVRLGILPIITTEDRIQLSVVPEVSSLDYANAVVVSGFRIPALRTRRAETTVNIADGQSLIIGGLLQTESAELVRKIPILGDLPIIGELFKSRSFVRGESELVIIITPQIVRPNTVAAEGG